MTIEPRGIHSIDHFALFVPSLSDAEYFYQHFGLEVSREASHLMARAADGHLWMKIYPAERKHLAYISFRTYPKRNCQIENNGNF
ncbi:hypothetical protein F9C28_16520 [Shimwellia pseudoproteus]|nr:hypothetical protein [Shimwellia pseudoproteus]